MNFFLQIYCDVIKSEVTKINRIETLVENITYKVFQIICNGLFNNHKRTFAFMIAATIQMKEKKQLDLKELNYLFKIYNQN